MRPASGFVEFTGHLAGRGGRSLDLEFIWQLATAFLVRSPPGHRRAALFVGSRHPEELCFSVCIDPAEPLVGGLAAVEVNRNGHRIEVEHRSIRLAELV